MKRLLCAGLLLGMVHCVSAQVTPSLYDYARPSLKWYTIKTEHFNVVFHADGQEGSSRTAQVVARIAEEIYEPITTFYEHAPNSPVTIIIKDYEDYSNGAAYFFDNKMEIWAPALDSPLRGDHNWLRNVITHEFVHMVQVQVTMKLGRSLPLGYLQILDYENVRRPDVLYGYPNVIVSYPVPSLNNPAWLAEGTAQYQRAGIDYDQWDTHRDMFLRTRILSGNELSLVEMGSFYSKSSLMREGVYNHGFAFTRYLAATYGEDVLREISQSLGKWRNWNVERAMRDALGVPATDVYDDWMRTMKEEYQRRTTPIRENTVEGQLVEMDGHNNYYPTFSPDGTQLAYVSNRGQHSSQTSLYVRDLASGDAVSYELEGLLSAPSFYVCALGHRLRQGVGGAVTWRPDGKAVVFARRRTTPEGYSYSDLYEIDLVTKKEKRLTREARAALPAYAPEGNRIVFVSQKDGTTNLWVLDVASGEVRSLTSFGDGSQVSDPAWHPQGAWIYFARLLPGAHGRDVWRIRADGTMLEVVYATEADERSPSFGGREHALHFSSDASGIYNLYRLEDDVSRALTNVLGGAFMPSVRTDGTVAYAHFQWDGYKIALLESESTVVTTAYEVPAILQESGTTDPVLARHDDHYVRALEEGESTLLREKGHLVLPTDSLEADVYTPITTGFSFFPVIRLDQYVSRRRSMLDSRLPDRTRAGTFLRNMKIGVYVSSREVLEEMSLFGGLVVAPASGEGRDLSDYLSPSQLLQWERDAFLIFDYKKGLGIIPGRWSPQFSIELYNIRRRVENGLSIEEFPCTACFPDTTLIDLSYVLWEADIYARSKINSNVLLEVGYRYSPYRVITEGFFSREAQQSIPESSSRYFIGQTILAGAHVEALTRHRDSDVLPSGLRLDMEYELVTGRLLERFNIEDGFLSPVYGEKRLHRLTLDARFSSRFANLVRGGVHGFSLRLRASSILGPPVDDFYNDYVGGLAGARGYPFYALGGNETLWLHASYLLPLMTDIRRQFLFIYIDKAYMRIYADAASAWSGAWPGISAVRKDVGAELRVKLGSFYLFPTAVFLSGTYGVDAFDFQLDGDFVTPSGENTVRYGSSMQWHFGVLFGFDT